MFEGNRSKKRQEPHHLSRGGRHKAARDPRAHWLLLMLVLPVMFGLLMFQGWTTHEVDAAKTRRPCTSPVPRALADGGPVVQINGGRVRTVGMPAGTVALTYDGGPDPVQTPRLLDLLRRYDARATFFVSGAKAAQYPDLVRRIRAEGHEIGSNTYTGADMGTASSSRSRMELSLTESALAGSVGVQPRLLRLPLTTDVDTLCGDEWQAARRVAAEGYALVAADRSGKKPSQGLVRQFSQTDTAYQETEKLLKDPRAKKFTTVTGGLGVPRSTSRSPAWSAGRARR
ncbi:hypothetical protein SVIO_073790 [Streptomyces violaceusniger]|uniref:NodB homology domain-containing protein n=1 Tax=Streptomyces violaceusniger TaxID=68280 RepID=A0A4D4LC37_STRVO|nr:hypothetical protein SVIO_073790 [Streptomyces violaceusniger]